MSTRGSLKTLIHQMGVLFAQGRYDSLAILANDRGKYYTLLTPVEMAHKITNKTDGHLRLIIHCTEHELRSITYNGQTNFFPNPS